MRSQTKNTSRSGAVVRYCGLQVLGGLLLAAAFPPFDVKWLAWFALVPFSIGLRATPSVRVYVGAYLGSAAFMLLGFDWMRTSNGGVGLSGPRVIPWVLMSAFLALSWPAMLAVGRRFQRRACAPMWVTLPLVWTSYEYLRMQSGALMSDLPSPWLQVGLTQANVTRIVQIADLGGVWTVTALVASINGLWLDVAEVAWRIRVDARIPRMRTALLAVAPALYVASFLYGNWRLSQTVPCDGPVVWLMPSPSKGGYSLDSFKERFGSGGRCADVLLWSETAFPDLLNDSPSGRSRASDRQLKDLQEFAAQTKSVLIVGCERFGNRSGTLEKYNSAAVVDQVGVLVGHYDKHCLVPWSEVTPSIGKLLCIPGRTEFTSGTDWPVFTLGLSGDAGLPDRQYKLAATICYDTCFPAIHRSFFLQRRPDVPDFFVACSHEGADRTQSLQNTMVKMARFRAIECRRALVRNASRGYSGMIDGNGQVLSAPVNGKIFAPFNVGQVPMDDRTSVYVMLGDWIPFSACGVLAIVSLWPLKSSIAATVA